MTIEDERYSLQLKLDSQKTDKERNELGQFSTPFPLAMEMAEYALSVSHPGPLRFLEPSIGTGVFYSALRRISGDIEYARGYEIDSHYYTPTKEFWRHDILELINGDFFNQAPQRRYNLILANPPYSRHHHINELIKKQLQERVYSEYGISISGLAGLYCYFLILSTSWLENDGISCWLIPSEFLDVKYGEAVKQFLCTKVELLSIHRFDPSDLQFADALVSSSIVTFRNRPPHGRSVRLSTGGRPTEPTISHTVSIGNINPTDKWSLLFNDETESIDGLPLGHYFKVSRGISTGNNSFFIISKAEAERRQLPAEFLTPILPAPRHLKESLILEERSNLHEENLFFLLSCPLDINDVRDRYPNLYEYIVEGELNNANAGYNCRRRIPWYMSETRKPAPIYMTYMGRGENSQRMFRFILNESESVVSNSYLMLFPKEEYKTCLKDRYILKAVWETLNNIPKSRLSQCGRSYGGGLFKIEPRELERLKVPELQAILISGQGNLFA